MDKIEILENKILSIINAHSFPSNVTEWENGKIKSIQNGFIRDTDNKFRKIANEIAKTIINETKNT